MRKLTDLILGISPCLRRPLAWGRMLPATMFLLVFASWSPRDTSAQYMFLDVDGDGVSTPKDVLDPVWPTTLSIWLVTDHNRDGSPAVCSAGGRSLSINSYEVVVRADSGAVSWGAYQNRMAEFNLHFGAASSQTEFHEGYGSFSYLAPGKYLLATLDVTVISGRPRLTPSASSQLAATFLTSFGSECDGREGDNSVALGRDWFDVDGVGTGSGGGWDDGPIPESITVGQGVVYFGGNRIPAPLTIGFEGADAVVNGARLPPLEQPPIPAGARTSSDALRFELDSTGTALTRDGVRKGLSRAELLQQLRTHYASSELVREVQVEGERLRVTYVDYPIQTIVYMPSRIPMTDPSPEERRRSDAVHAYALLRETKAILDQGAVVLITRDGWTTVPPLIARQVDDALQSLQAGAGVTTVRRELLDSTIPADVQAWVRQPARLDPVGGGDK